MSLNLGSASIRFKADTTDFDRGYGRVQKETSSLGSTLGGVGKKAGAFAVAFGAAGIAGGFMKAMTAGIKFNSSIEQTTISMKTMLGSQEKANKLIKEMTAFAAKTPYEFPELADATKKLLAFGVAADNIIPTMTRLGDISAGLGIEVSELAELYGKAKVQGRLFAEDVNQLTGRGIPVIQEFAKQFGVAESEVRSLVEKGMVGFPNLEEAIRSLTSEGGKFGGLMEAQSKSLAGQWSTVKDNFNKMAGQLAKPAFIWLTEKGMPALNRFIEDISAAIEKGDWGAVGERIGTAISDGISASAPYVVRGLGGLVAATVRELQDLAGFGWMNSTWLKDRAMASIAPNKSHKLAPITGALGTVHRTAEIQLDTATQEAFAAATAKASAAIGAFGQNADMAAESSRYWGSVMAATQTHIDNMIGRTAALATEFANMIDPASIWDKAKGSLKAYKAEIKKQLAAARADAAAFSKVQTWFPDVPPSVWAKMASMPGFAAALAKEGQAAANGMVWDMAVILAAGGDTGAQAYVNAFGKPKVSVTVQATGLSAAWQGIVDYFSKRHITIDTRMGGYTGATGYAAGGIIDRPTFAMLGERNRKEAVVPLEDPVRKQQVLREAGLLNENNGTDTGTIAAAVESGIARGMDMFINRFGRLAASGAF